MTQSDIRRLTTVDGAEPRSAAREALAAAIEEKTIAEEALATHARNVDRLRTRAWAASTAVDAAKATLDEVQAATIKHLAEQSPAPSMTVREARRALEDAQDEFAILESAREAAKKAAPDLESSVAAAAMKLRGAMAKVIADDPITRQLAANYHNIIKQMVDGRRVLFFLQGLNALPSDIHGWGGEERWPDLPSEGRWRAAVETLSRDADAPLPSETS